MGSFSIQKFIVQILELYKGFLSCNVIFQKWGRGAEGRLEFFQLGSVTRPSMAKVMTNNHFFSPSLINWAPHTSLRNHRVLSESVSAVLFCLYVYQRAVEHTFITHAKNYYAARLPWEHRFLLLETINFKQKESGNRHIVTKVFKVLHAKTFKSCYCVVCVFALCPRSVCLVLTS